MSPPCSLTMLYVIESPRPVPVPTSFVVKNGSKTRLAISAGIPGPVSSKTIRIRSRSSDETIRIFFRASGTSSSASRAFVSRLMKTCSSWMGLPCTMSASGQRSRSTSIAAQAQLLLHQRERALDHLVDVDGLERDGSRAAERAQVGDDLRRLPHLLHRLLEVLARALGRQLAHVIRSMTLPT